MRVSECAEGGCEAPVVVRGRCENHYASPGFIGPRKFLPSELSLDQALSFFGWFQVPGPLTTPCWVWGGTLNHGGYGRFRFQGKRVMAHRAAYMVHNGDIPDGLLIRHRCDNPPCINPQHLVTGTDQDNFNDRVSRKGHPSQFPEKAPAAKLTWEIVEEIRAAHRGGETNLSQIAVKYGVTRPTISDVVKGITWRA